MKSKRATGARRGRLFRIFKRLLQAALVAFVLSAVFSSFFIGFRCFSGSERAQAPSLAVERATGTLTNYAREEVSTFLTLPEWYIVYNSEEYARFTGMMGPSRFPYLGSIRQYWRYYDAVCRATKGVYPFSGGNHVMLSVIGSSLTIEYALKGLYENTFGRLTEVIAGRDTPEDLFAHRTALEYGAFMHTVPWYEFPFISKIGQLWRETPLLGPHFVRKWERKMALTAEYGAKGVYGWVIGFFSGVAYGGEEQRIHAWIDNASEAIFADGVVKKVQQLGPRSFIVTIPRYEAFTARAVLLVQQGVRFLEIAGNDEILITVLAPAVVAADRGLEVLLDEPLLTDRETRRLAVNVRVRSLHEVILQLEKIGATVEHLYDY